MTIQEAQERALAIRNKYAQLEEKNTGSSWSRADLVQGFVGDVGDLAKLAMAKDGKRHIDDVDAKIAHELADCLWSILVIARKYDVDMESAYLNTMQELDERVSGELVK